MTPFDRANELLFNLTNAYEECLKAIVKTDLLPTLASGVVYIEFDSLPIRGSVCALANGKGEPLAISEASQQWLYDNQAIIDELNVNVRVNIADLQ